VKLGADRALADALGGSAAGWAFWRAALAAVEVAVERSRDRGDAFCSYPAGELRRFVRDLDDALALAETAVKVQELVNGDGEGSIADVLAARVRRAG
jgi:hypothetical protein